MISFSSMRQPNDVLNLFGAESYAESTGNALPEGIKMIVRLHEMQQKDA